MAKLRNKKTGEIGFVRTEDWKGKEYFMICVGKWHLNEENNCWEWDAVYKYSSLAELNEKWEDYEEQSFWYINEQGVVDEYPPSLLYRKGIIGNYKRIGNCFDTKEEAEKSVEKLKAWKRLKDKGFEFTGWDRHPDFPGDFRITASDEWTCDDKDLDLLFGGEE